MKYVWVKFSMLCACTALSACGGGATTGGGALSTASASNPQPVDPSNLPIVGGATYTGFISLNLPSDPEPGSVKARYSGDLDLAVDFGAVQEAMTGVARDFRGPTGAAVDGRLFVSDGTLQRTASVQEDYTFEALISGTLDGDGLRNTVVNGEITGDFLGTNQEGISGVAFGNTTTFLGGDTFDGSLAVARN